MKARLPAALAVGLFAVYALGACRTIYVGDSGELVAAVATLGIPHPSGYPLYVLLGKLWTVLVPVGSIAFRMSLFSAACAAATGALVFATVRRLAGGDEGGEDAEDGTVAGLFAALLLAFSPSFWSQATIQRVYTLNALFVIATTWLAVRWLQDRRRRWLAAAFFAAALGACNHTFMGVFAIVLGLFAVLVQPSLLKPATANLRTLGTCAAATVAGLLPYLYLPLRSRQDPRLDWGDPETLDAFLGVVLRRDFWGRAWYESPSDLLPIGLDFLAGLAAETLIVGTVLAAVGALAGWRRDGRSRRWALLPLLVIAANFATMALHGSRSDIFIWHRYYIPSYVMVAVLAGAGWTWIGRQIADRRPAVRRVCAVVALAVPAVLLAQGWTRHDRSRYRIAEDFSRTLLATLPPGAHLSASDDNVLFVLIYLHLVEGLRPDLDLILQGVGDADLPPLRFDPDTDPLYFTHHPNWSLEALDVVPVGLVFRTARLGAPPPVPTIPKWRLDGEDDPRVPKDYLTQNLIGLFHYMLGVTHEDRDWPVAQRELETAMAAAPRNDVLFYNLGLIYRRNGLPRRALAALRRSAEINPRHIASSNPVRASERIAEVEAELAHFEAVESRLRTDPSLAPLGDGTAAWHRRLADLLDAAGERMAALGHRRLASEME